MTVNAYPMLFTDQNINREFVIQPYTTNGPATPTGGVDPGATSANTTLFLYGKGAPNYGERIQENMIFMLEHFFGSNEPSFPTPGQVWFNNSVTPAQLFVFNPRKYSVISSSGNVIAVTSTGGLDSLSTVLARFTTLNTQTKTIAVFSPTYVQLNYVQTATPVISGPMVQLSVSPATPVSSLAGSFIGGWEDIFQSNVSNVMRQPLNANGQKIINLGTATNPGDATSKAYVDAAVSGGSLTLSSLSDVQFATPGFPQTNSMLFYNGTKWTDLPIATAGFLPISGGTMTGSINMGGSTLVGVPSPTNPQDAANKNYVDNQPLSSQVVLLTAPANLDLLTYNSGSLKWVNLSATAAGVLPLTGGVMTGSINMSTNIITGLPTPVNPTDAANKAYVDTTTGSGNVISGTFDDNSGTLTLNRSAPFVGTPVIVTGFLPTPNNQVQAIDVAYQPPDPANVSPVPGMFFQSTLSDTGTASPLDIENPVNVRLEAALSQLDLSLGSFTVPRQRIAFVATGANTTYNLNTGKPLTTAALPKINYVVGSNSLSVFVNGIKQVTSDFGLFTITSVNTVTTEALATFNPTNTIVVTGNVTSVFRPGVQFSVTGTASYDGSYIVLSSTIAGPNTNIVVTSNLFSSTPGAASFPLVDTGTLTYGPFGIMPSMQTGYTFGGPTNPLSMDVAVNGFSPVTITIDTSLVNCNNFGLLADAINNIASTHYINNVTGGTVGALGNFVVQGDRTSEFPTGTNFLVRYSTANNGPYTVGPGSPVFSLGQTTIPITTSVPSSTFDGIIFQDPWGFTMKIENGAIIFYSNIAGSGSSVTPTDTGISGLLSSVTGGNWPLQINTPLIGTTNPLTPTTYGYSEIGLQGYQSCLIDFVVAPLNTDTVEIVVDHDIVYNKFNPFLNAVTA